MISSFVFSALATSLLSFAFGLFVILKGPQKKVNQLWIMTCFSIGWWSLGIGMMVHSVNFRESFFWLRWFTNLGSIMIPILYLHFIHAILSLKRPITLILGYATALILEILNLGKYFCTIAMSSPFPFYNCPLQTYILFVIYFFIVVIYTHWLLWSNLPRTEGKLREQLKYIFTGTAIGFLGGSTTFFPVYKIPIFPYGIHLVFIYIVTISYAIVKHQLMDINIVIQKTALYSALAIILTSIYLFIGTVLAHLTEGFLGHESIISAAIAALLISLIFHPLSRKIQLFLDNHIFRHMLDEELFREIASGFVHELKTPLANISLPTELVLLDLRDVHNGKKKLKDIFQTAQQRLKYVLQQSQEAGAKIDALRQVSRLERPPSTPISLQDIIDNSISKLQKLAEESNVLLTKQYEPSVSRTSGNHQQLEIVFINLLKNAIEAAVSQPMQNTQSPSMVQVLLEQEEDWVVVHIRDNGPGIPRENLNHIFRPYFSTKQGKGMGVGLYLSRKVIKAHGGSIDVKSHMDPDFENGTEFIIRMPKAFAA